MMTLSVQATFRGKYGKAASTVKGAPPAGYFYRFCIKVSLLDAHRTTPIPDTRTPELPAAPDDKTRESILVDNPAELYGWPALK